VSRYSTHGPLWSCAPQPPNAIRLPSRD
jgi:hypothetical protein